MNALAPGTGKTWIPRDGSGRSCRSREPPRNPFITLNDFHHPLPLHHLRTARPCKCSFILPYHNCPPPVRIHPLASLRTSPLPHTGDRSRCSWFSVRKSSRCSSNTLTCLGCRPEGCRIRHGLAPLSPAPVPGHLRPFSRRPMPELGCVEQLIAETGILGTEGGRAPP